MRVYTCLAGYGAAACRKLLGLHELTDFKLLLAIDWAWLEAASWPAVESLKQKAFIFSSQFIQGISQTQTTL